MEKKFPYPLIPSNPDREKEFARFKEIFKQLQSDMRFSIANERMLMYAKFMKDTFKKKKDYIEEEETELGVSYSAIIQKKPPSNLKILEVLIFQL